jgi:hypothetical protein
MDNQLKQSLFIWSVDVNNVDFVRLGFTFPQFDGLVVFQGGRRNDILGRVACCAQNYVCVTSKFLYNFFGLEVPNVNLKKGCLRRMVKEFV